MPLLLLLVLVVLQENMSEDDEDEDEDDDEDEEEEEDDEFLRFSSGPTGLKAELCADVIAEAEGTDRLLMISATAHISQGTLSNHQHALFRTYPRPERLKVPF